MQVVAGGAISVEHRLVSRRSQNHSLFILTLISRSFQVLDDITSLYWYIGGCTVYTTPKEIKTSCLETLHLSFTKVPDRVAVFWFLYIPKQQLCKWPIERESGGNWVDLETNSCCFLIPESSFYCSRAICLQLFRKKEGEVWQHLLLKKQKCPHHPLFGIGRPPPFSDPWLTECKEYHNLWWLLQLWKKVEIVSEIL